MLGEPAPAGPHPGSPGPAGAGRRFRYSYRPRIGSLRVIKRRASGMWGFVERCEFGCADIMLVAVSAEGGITARCQVEPQRFCNPKLCVSLSLGHADLVSSNDMMMMLMNSFLLEAQTVRGWFVFLRSNQ